jgi:hypothetical protein
VHWYSSRTKQLLQLLQLPQRNSNWATNRSAPVSSLQVIISSCNSISGLNLLITARLLCKALVTDLQLHPAPCQERDHIAVVSISDIRVSNVALSVFTCLLSILKQISVKGNNGNLTEDRFKALHP